MVSRDVAVVKRCQGNLDASSNWAKANKAQTGQFLLRLGEDVDLKCYEDENGNLPKGFTMDNNSMPIVYKYGLTFWDESHAKCRTTELGDHQSSNRQFPRDEEGNYDPTGTYSLPAQACTHKYEKEVRMCYGVGMVMRGGEEVGVRLLPFDYSDKKLVTQETMEKERWSNIKLIKTNASRNSRAWTDNPRPEGSYYSNESIGVVKGVGPKKVGPLVAAGLSTVGDLRMLVGKSDAELKAVANKVNGVGVASIKKWIEETSNVIMGDAPVTISHLDHPNPFESKYKDDWRVEIDKIPAMRKFVNVRSMVIHIVEQCKSLYAGTDMEDKWFFYHDALKLMTADATIEWMRQEGYLKYWLKPEHGICAAWSKFDKAFVGNQTEKQPLDNTLFQDGNVSVDRHVILSHAICNDKDDPRMFSMATPKLGASAYKRIFHPVTGVAPTSERIIQDIKAVFVNMKIIFDADGAHVPGLANRSGHRKVAGRTGKGQWGGKREKTPVEDFLLGGEGGQWTGGGIGDLHDDVKELFNEHEMLKASNIFFEKKISTARLLSEEVSEGV